MKKSRILKYASRSDLMNVSIKLKDKTFTFNLFEELQISEEVIDEELKEQPSYYGYLGMLRNKLERKVNDLSMEVEKEYATLYLRYKENSKETNKAEASREAKFKVERNPKYLGLIKKLNEAKEDLGTIKVCIDSFDQRSRMVQSVNANIRSEH